MMNSAHSHWPGFLSPTSRLIADSFSPHLQLSSRFTFFTVKPVHFILTISNLTNNSSRSTRSQCTYFCICKKTELGVLENSQNVQNQVSLPVIYFEQINTLYQKKCGNVYSFSYFTKIALLKKPV